MGRQPPCVAFVAWTALVYFAGPAFAQAPDEAARAAARQLGQDGVEFYEKGDYARALDNLDRAYSVVKVATLGLWLGRALDKMGRLVEASQRYREATLLRLDANAPTVLLKAQADAQKEYDALIPRLAQLTVELSGAAAGEATVSVDGKALPQALVGAAVPANPGAHELEARRGAEVATDRVTLREGERRTVRLVLSPPVPPVVVPVLPVAPVAPVTSAQSARPNDTPPPARPAGKYQSQPSDREQPPEPEVEGGSSAWIWTLVGTAVTGGTAVGFRLLGDSQYDALNKKCAPACSDEEINNSGVKESDALMVGFGAASGALLITTVILAIVGGMEESEGLQSHGTTVSWRF